MRVAIGWRGSPHQKPIGAYMAIDATALRRRAAIAVFGDVLNEAALRTTLREAGTVLRSDRVSEIIAFVDGVARSNHLDSVTAKRLYVHFFGALRQPVDALPTDPWAHEDDQSGRASAPHAPNGATAATLDMARSSVRLDTGAGTATTVATAPRAARIAARDDYPADSAAPETASSAPPSQPLPATPTATDALAPYDAPNDPMAVFSAVLRSVMAELQQFHREALGEVAADAVRILAMSAVPLPQMQKFFEASARPTQSQWEIAADTGDLAAMTSAIAGALTQSFGRAGAEQILARALANAERMPEARRFAPRRLLSTA
jgi:hypothetical protein